MAFCKKCGAELENNAQFCTKCGQVQDENTVVNSADDIKANKILAFFAYWGILVLIPLIAAPKSKFARFHANQGLVLLLISIALSFISNILATYLFAVSDVLGTIFALVYFLIGVFILILCIMGMVNAIKGNFKELPFIGSIKILK